MPDHFNMHNSSQRLEDSQEKAHIKYSRVKRKILKHVWPLRIAIVASVILLVGLFITLFTSIFGNLGIGKMLGFAGDFVSADEKKIVSDGGRVNILVMGKGGGVHAGADLTDTIIVASISFNNPSIDMISIPRDLWIPEIRAKVNSAYYWGNQNNVGGMVLAKSVVEDVVGIPLHYGVVLDFSSFKEVVDVLGGINVNVSNSFTDNKYPIAGKENDLCGGDREYKCRYETITFDKGEVFMNGETALKFVRSRNAEGDEGTDLAREARQQAVISAIKNKVLSKDTLLNLKKIRALKMIFVASIETDLPPDSLAVIARKMFDARDSLNSNLIPDTLLTNPPISPTYDKQYVFIPTLGSGNWKEINEWVISVLTN